MSDPGFCASTAFLLRHELRLWLRRTFDVKVRARRLVMAVLVLAMVTLHLLAYGTVAIVSHVPKTVPAELILPLMSGAVGVLLTLIIAQALSGAVRAFFEAGTLDLVFSAPVPPQRIFAVRALALAIATTAPFCIFLAPLAHMGLLRGQPAWLSIYPVTAALGLAGTAVGLVLALGLVRLIGPRLTRTAGQALAVLIGTGLGFAIHAFNRLPIDRKLTLLDEVSVADPAAAGLAWLPGRALLGEIEAVILLLLLGAAIFALTAQACGALFARSRAAASGVAAPGRQGPARERPLRFRANGPAALRRKEWLLLVRDPWILMPVLQRAFALIPVGLALAGLEGGDNLATSIIAPMLVVFAGKLAGGIAWLTLAAEEAPELIATAPVPAGSVSRAKVEAALTASVLLFGLPVLLMALRDPAAAVWTGLGCAFATVAATLLALAEPSRIRRRDFGDRFRNSGVFALAELVVTLSLAGATWLAVVGSWIGALAAAMLAAGLLAAFLIGLSPRDPAPRKTPLPGRVDPAPNATR